MFYSLVDVSVSDHCIDDILYIIMCISSSLAILFPTYQAQCPVSMLMCIHLTFVIELVTCELAS